MRLADVCLALTLFLGAFNAQADFVGASGQHPDTTRKPAHMSVRDHYQWAISLTADTKAAVGPVAAERILKLRLDPPVQSGPETAAELIRICIQERYCKTTPLGPTPDGPVEVSFDQELAQLVEEYGRPSLDKLYVTVQRETSNIDKALELTILVETELTMKMPEFHLVPAVGLNDLDIEPAHINESRAK